ncbi:MAG: Rrf2 family transcriptional regulator [Bryobacteraceae bacterium]|nr:Rrf2 family transcriptional regulator [Bryobacteraceae bacterium]
MLKLTKKADYGLISLKHLALLEIGKTASAKEIAEAYRIPAPILAKVLQQLVRHGFLVSEQGTNGGYRLSKDPSMMTTLEVIRAIDGPIILTNCFTEHGECGLASKCSVREPLRKVHEGILKLLDSITIHDLSDDTDQELRVPGPGPLKSFTVLHS